MKNLIFNGSPRLDGASITICNLIEKELTNTDVILSYQRKVEPCVHCDACVDIPECPIRDKMQDIYEKIIKCKNLIFIVPVYFMGIPAPLKAMIDRTQVFWNHPIQEKKNGAVIMIAENSNQSFKAFYEKTWAYILKNIGVEKPVFELWGNIKKISDIDNDQLNIVISTIKSWQ